MEITEEYKDTTSYFYCSRCEKRFQAKAFTQRDGLGNMEERLSDEQITYIDVNSDMRYLFCSRCTRAFYTFLYKYKRR